jgi:hypothetical protein
VGRTSKPRTRRARCASNGLEPLRWELLLRLIKLLVAANFCPIFDRESALENPTISGRDTEIELKRRARRERRKEHLSVDVDRRVADRREGSRQMRLRSLWLRIVGKTDGQSV